MLLNRVYQNIGVSNGLQGCIRKFKIGRRNIEMHNSDDLIAKIVGVHECGENPCYNSVACQNGGVCKAIDSELYRCECKPEYTGSFCESIINACLSNPCKAGATCDSLTTEKYLCRCPPGRKGLTCETGKYINTSFILMLLIKTCYFVVCLYLSSLYMLYFNFTLIYNYSFLGQHLDM